MRRLRHRGGERAVLLTMRLATALSAFVLLHADPATTQTLTYTIAAEEHFDTPAKAQAGLHVVIQGQPTRASLDELLTRLYRETAARPSRYHGRVTHVAIFAYETEAHAKAGMAQWLGMISRIGATAAPKTEIRDDRIAALTAPKETRFGLSEDQRKAVWKELALAERQARQDARAKHPDPPSLARNADALAAFKRQDEYQRSLVKAADAAIGKRYKLSSDQLLKISVEAHEKNWPW